LSLVIKCHPKESTGADQIFKKPYNNLLYRHLEKNDLLRSEHIIIDHNNKYDTSNLIHGAKAVVTVNSQTGLEAAAQGRPVIVW
jgi:capsule polysaccharide modification protein KpsS